MPPPHWDPLFKVTGPIQNRCVNTMFTTFNVFFSVVLPELNEKSLFIFSSCLLRFTFDLYGEVTVALIQKDIEKYLWSISHAIFSTWQSWRIRSQGWKDKMAIRNLIVCLHESFAWRSEHKLASQNVANYCPYSYAFRESIWIFFPKWVT